MWTRGAGPRGDLDFLLELRAVTRSSRHPLRSTTRPDFELGSAPVRIVDLYAGCGGLTLGIAQAASSRSVAVDVRLAVDLDKVAIDTFADNFPKANVAHCSVESLFDGELGAEPTKAERTTAKETGRVHALVGGPPCQGHSDLNNHTRRDDPKNALYARMARAAEILKPDLVLIENVPTVQHDKGGVVAAARDQLVLTGYEVVERVVRLEALGVAQRRRRHVLIGRRLDRPLPSTRRILSALSPGKFTVRDVKWAIEDLAQEDGDGIDKPARASADNIKRMTWLLEQDEYDLPNVLRPPCHQDEHSYKSMYGRLRWDEPAQTVTSGFGSIGQGRYMHPSLPRALTPHEAARLQGFPDYFRFDEFTKRADLATMIGNAVPPALSSAVFRVALKDWSLTHLGLPNAYAGQRPTVVRPIAGRTKRGSHPTPRSQPSDRAE